MIKERLKLKFVLALVGVSVLVVIITSYFSERTAQDIIVKKTQEAVETSVHDFANRTTTTLSHFEKTLDLLVTSETMTEILKEHDLRNFMNRKSDTRWEYYRKNVMYPLVDVDKESIRLLYVGSQKHGENYRHNDTNYVNYDARKRVWFQSSVSNPDNFVYTSYLSHDKKKIDVTISRPIFDGKNLIGVAGIDILTEKIFRELTSQSFDSTKISIVVDTTGRIIYHPNQAYLLKNITDTSVAFSPSFVALVKNMMHGTTGDATFISSDGEVFLFHSAPIGETGWQFGYGIRKSAYDSSINELIVKMLVTNLVVIVLLVILLWWMTGKMLRPIRLVVEELKNIAEGNSSGSKKIAITSEDEVGELAKWFNKFSESLVSILDRSRVSGVEVSLLSQKLNESMAQLNAAAIQQSAAVSQTTSAMEEMYQTSSKISDNATNVVEIAEITQHTAKTGVDKVNKLIQKMEDVERINQHRTQEVIVLNKKVARITEIIGLIRDINEQTKLIAFNAALEASGAGEAGKRFGVVASEIRRLADTVQESMEEIRTMIDEIQNQTELLLKSTDQSTNIVIEGVQFSKEMEESLKNIYMGTKNTTDSSQQINMATSQQKTASEQIVATLHDISEAVNHVVNMSAEVRLISEQLQNLSDEFSNITIK